MEDMNNSGRRRSILKRPSENLVTISESEAPGDPDMECPPRKRRVSFGSNSFKEFDLTPLEDSSDNKGPADMDISDASLNGTYNIPKQNATTYAKDMELSLLEQSTKLGLNVTATPSSNSTFVVNSLQLSNIRKRKENTGTTPKMTPKKPKVMSTFPRVEAASWLEDQFEPTLCQSESTVNLGAENDDEEMEEEFPIDKKLSPKLKRYLNRSKLGMDIYEQLYLMDQCLKELVEMETEIYTEFKKFYENTLSPIYFQAVEGHRRMVEKYGFKCYLF